MYRCNNNFSLDLELTCLHLFFGLRDNQRNTVQRIFRLAEFSRVTKRAPPCGCENQFHECQNYHWNTIGFTRKNKFWYLEWVNEVLYTSNVQKMNKDDKLYVPADKMTNFYQVSPDKYNDLMQQNINKDYKKTSTKSVRNSTLKDKQITDKLDISDRIDTTAQSEAFITLRDHKPNFTNKPTCRLINPCKSEIWNLSKQILERIKSQIIRGTNLKQWKNTDEVIQWFNGINNKQKYSFIAFDVCEFYPSITDDLLSNALSFASKYDNISDDEKHVLKKTELKNHRHKDLQL